MKGHLKDHRVVVDRAKRRLHPICADGNGGRVSSFKGKMLSESGIVSCDTRRQHSSHACKPFLTIAHGFGKLACASKPLDFSHAHLPLGARILPAEWSVKPGNVGQEE
jgi:hypothetical protein